MSLCLKMKPKRHIASQSNNHPNCLANFIFHGRYLLFLLHLFHFFLCSSKLKHIRITFAKQIFFELSWSRNASSPFVCIKDNKTLKSFSFFLDHNHCLIFILSFFLSKILWPYILFRFFFIVMLCWVTKNLYYLI